VRVEDNKTDGVNLKSDLTRNRIKPARRKYKIKDKIKDNDERMDGRTAGLV
jgi:hypothetical protein